MRRAALLPILFCLGIFFLAPSPSLADSAACDAFVHEHLTRLRLGKLENAEEVKIDSPAIKGDDERGRAYLASFGRTFTKIRELRKKNFPREFAQIFYDKDGNIVALLTSETLGFVSARILGENCRPLESAEFTGVGNAPSLVVTEKTCAEEKKFTELLSRFGNEARRQHGNIASASDRWQSQAYACRLAGGEVDLAGLRGLKFPECKCQKGRVIEPLREACGAGEKVAPPSHEWAGMESYRELRALIEKLAREAPTHADYPVKTDTHRRFLPTLASLPTLKRVCAEDFFGKRNPGENLHRRPAEKRAEKRAD